MVPTQGPLTKRAKLFCLLSLCLEHCIQRLPRGVQLHLQPLSRLHLLLLAAELSLQVLHLLGGLLGLQPRLEGSLCSTRAVRGGSMCQSAHLLPV